MTTHEFNNHTDQQTRRRVERDTYLSRAKATLDDEAGGRFTKQMPSTIIHKNPAAQYPRLPSSSPWSAPCPSGGEPPLNVDVNAVPDLGFSAAPPTTNSGEANEASASPPLAIEASPSFLKRRI